MMRWILKIKIYYITNHKFCKYIFLGMEFNSCDKMIKNFHPIQLLNYGEFCMKQKINKKYF